MKKVFSRADAVLIAVILLAACAVALFSLHRETGVWARIEKDGVTLEHFRLSEDLPYREFVIGGETQVTIAAQGGQIWFAESQCPDLVCVRTGKLSKSGDTAVCLPARVTVTVEGEKQAIDAVTG